MHGVPFISLWVDGWEELLRWISADEVSDVQPDVMTDSAPFRGNPRIGDLAPHIREQIAEFLADRQKLPAVRLLRQVMPSWGCGRWRR